MRPRCEKHHTPLHRTHTASGKLLWLCQYWHPRRRRFRPRSGGCAVCGEEVFKHKPNSYYGRIEHGYRRG